jgi:hypothetical protein
MSNTSDQQHGAARNQRTWSTTATCGSGSTQSRYNTDNVRVTDASTGSTGSEVPYSIQRWLAERPHEGPWNELISFDRSKDQAGKRS